MANAGSRSNRSKQWSASRNYLTYGILKLHPYWDSLRGDPHFEKIVASLAPKNSKR
jgi:hypothetical protein